MYKGQKFTGSLNMSLTLVRTEVKNNTSGWLVQYDEDPPGKLRFVANTDLRRLSWA